jgi:hypothetical protein
MRMGMPPRIRICEGSAGMNEVVGVMDLPQTKNPSEIAAGQFAF